MGGQAPGFDQVTSRSIAIRNVYVMTAYAFRSLRNDGAHRFEKEDFDHLHDLLAEILIRGVGSQVKRGLYKDYRLQNEQLATVRGRINVSRTISTRSSARGSLQCEFDEYEIDTPHNRALKAVLVLLIRQGEVSAHRQIALRRLLPYLDSVSLIAPSSIQWNELTYHRSNAAYRLLLGVCEMIVRGMIPIQEAGDSKLESWISDEAMSYLYERFIREYFKFHHPQLKPSAPIVPWDFDKSDAFGHDQLPSMRTDVTLRNEHRRVIIEAKFYQRSMQMSKWGNKSTIHSGNLYQLLSYVKNADVDGDGSVSGLLLYAGTDAEVQPDMDVVVQGNRIGAKTLDLSQPWDELRSRLEAITEWIEH